MVKEFNITGSCSPARHYMADTSGKLAQIVKMVEAGRYFVINRPRQYGKTTTLYSLTQMLNGIGEYLAFDTTFEGIGEEGYANTATFCRRFLMLLAESARHHKWLELAVFIESQFEVTQQMGDLGTFITALAEKTDKKIVLLIDEVDKSANNQLFLDFLGVLRSKFLQASDGRTKTFHSVILAGVHDVRNLKAKIRPDEVAQLNSPWNIATEFKVDLSLQPSEIKPMLDDYCRETGATMNTAEIAERLFDYTSGYPFLVSKLCKMLDEEIMPEKNSQHWTDDDLEIAVSRLVQEENTNFESLTKNLENNPELYKLVYDMVVEGFQMSFAVLDPIVKLGLLYGIFKNGRGLQIHNAIYREVILNYMIFKEERTNNDIQRSPKSTYTLPGNRLNLELLLTRFQEFMREQHSKHDLEFLERHGRLIFLAYLKPILNGAGYTFKESQISEERRLDVAITFFQHKYVAELKLWRGPKAHKAGLLQLHDYLDRLHLKEGYLVIFDHSAEKTWERKWIRSRGKKVRSRGSNTPAPSRGP